MDGRQVEEARVGLWTEIGEQLPLQVGIFEKWGTEEKQHVSPKVFCLSHQSQSAKKGPPFSSGYSGASPCNGMFHEYITLL